MAYSYDLRIRLLSAVQKGNSVPKVAEQFDVSQRTIFGWLRRKMETGDVVQQKGQRGPKPKLEQYRQQIEAFIAKRPEVTLEDLQRELQLPCCLKSIWNALHRWGIRLKKSHSSR